MIELAAEIAFSESAQQQEGHARKIDDVLLSTIKSG
jgi:hypothetical protein